MSVTLEMGARKSVIGVHEAPRLVLLNNPPKAEPANKVLFVS